jgi:CRISPR/Cas system-associated exonuclease Cas4 (RecB family)
LAQIKISAKNLGTLALPHFCPRCFWITMHCSKLPFQIFPGIFSSIDSYTKKVTNLHFERHNQLPSWLESLYVRAKPVKVPHHSKFKVLDEKTDILLNGMPDEILQKEDGSFLILDYKTARYTKTQDSLLPLYEVQLNAYAYIGKRNGFDPIAGLLLVYMEPQTDLSIDNLDSVIHEDGFLMGFGGHTMEIKLNDEKLIPPLLEEVRKIYDNPVPPDGNDECKDCLLLDELISIVGN